MLFLENLKKNDIKCFKKTSIETETKLSTNFHMLIKMIVKFKGIFSIT